jgi:hypothetical protein
VGRSFSLAFSKSASTASPSRRGAYRRAAIVLADFDRARRPRHAPAEVRLERSAELRREWAVVFDAPNVAACLIAWERPARNRDVGLVEEVPTWSPSQRATLADGRGPSTAANVAAIA